MSRYLIQTEDEISVHADGASGADFTLCGLTLDGDSDAGIISMEEVSNKEKITCFSCYKIFEACKRLKLSDFDV